MLALENMIDELSTMIDSLTIVYKGFNQSGFSSGGLIYKDFDSKLGSSSEFQHLLSTYQTDLINLYFYIDTLKVYEDSTYSTYRDVSQKINQNLLRMSGLTKDYFLITPLRVASAYLESVEKLNKKHVSSFAIGSIGHILYSDYKNKESSIDRGEAIKIYQQMFEDQDSTQVIYQPNQYLLKYTEKYLLTPTTSSRYRIYSDSVPFIPIVLAGVMEAYAPFGNFNASQKFELLKMIDFHLFPSYILTKESAYLLQDTELKQIYSSSFSTWKDPILADYLFVNEALKSVYNAKIVERNFLSTGVYEVVYDSGISIYINYTYDNYVFGLYEILARNYLVVNPND